MSSRCGRDGDHWCVVRAGLHLFHITSILPILTIMTKTPIKPIAFALFFLCIGLVLGLSMRPSSANASDLRLIRHDISTLSNAAAARDAAGVFLAIENRVSLSEDGHPNAWLRFPRDDPSWLAYHDAEVMADAISASMTQAEMDYAGIEDSPYIQAVTEGHPHLTPAEREAFYQRIEQDCARAFASLP